MPAFSHLMEISFPLRVYNGVLQVGTFVRHFY
jgi:hypothetical protein